MLSFFPTPYPDEWWYSVLCRYHVKSGNEKFQTTIRELFQGKPRTMIGAFFPNNTIYQICEQLPPSFTIKKLILEHTPFLYYMRMYTVQQKENFLEALCKGRISRFGTVRSVRRRSATDMANPTGTRCTSFLW